MKRKHLSCLAAVLLLVGCSEFPEVRDPERVQGGYPELMPLSELIGANVEPDADAPDATEDLRARARALDARAAGLRASGP